MPSGGGKLKQILTALLVALILISGCSETTLVAKPVSELNTVTEIEVEANVTDADVDPCAKVTCDTNSKCSEGSCVCSDGYKKCDGKCISSNACCKDADCGTNKICKDNVCTDTNCGYSQLYDSQKKTCVCSAESKYCAIQKKCIPKKSCCQHADCDTSGGCTQTQFLVRVCMKDDTTMCRAIAEKKKDSFDIGGFKYYVEFKSVLQNGKIDLLVNEKEFVLAINEMQPLDSSVKMYVEKFETIGGYCKEE